jgi:segregation and condensation protein B
MDDATCIARECDPEGSLLSPMSPAFPQAETPAPGADEVPMQLRINSNSAQSEGEPDVASIIEALLFASDTPLSVAKLADFSGAGATAVAVKQHIAGLNEKYAAAGLSFRIENIAKGYQMMSLAEFRPWIRKMSDRAGQSRLTNAALETLSIIAYRQPVIRADIEAIRGVSLGDAISRLREVGLVKVVGRAELVGRPMLYGTTRKFLNVFGLGDLKDLPKIENGAVMASRPKSKTIQEVEPVSPAQIPAPPLLQQAAVGA